MKVYKLEVLIIDYESLGAEEIKDVLENTKYPNWCITPQVMKIEEREISDWHDDHPLNKKDTVELEFGKLFST